MKKGLLPECENVDLSVFLAPETPNGTVYPGIMS